MSLTEFLSRRFGEPLTITVSPEAFTFEANGDTFRDVTLLRVRDGRLTAMGAEAHAPTATGTLISLFEDPRPAAWTMEHEDYCIMYCRYHLLLIATHDFWRACRIRPRVDVVGAETLRAFFRGREATILARVLREAGAGSVRFLDGGRGSPSRPNRRPHN